MPLRPVSELGLVDLADLAVRDGAEAEGPDAHAGGDEKRPQRSQSAPRASRQKTAGTPTAARAKARTNAAVAEASPSAKVPAKPAKSDRLPGSGTQRGAATARGRARQETAEPGRDVPRSRPADSTPWASRSAAADRGEMRESSPGKRGAPFLGGVAAVAGGVLAVRAASALAPAASKPSMVLRGRRRRRRFGF